MNHPASTDAVSAHALPRASLATRLAFFIAGFGLACWAPLVPYAKVRLDAGHAELGTVLLCLGLGSIVGMPLAGSMVSRLGSRAVILAGGIGLMLALPLLALAAHMWTLGAALCLFGLSLGAIDVAANVHGTEVQQRVGRPMMSGFHGLYSFGGLVGVSGMTLVLASGFGVLESALVAVGVVLVCLVLALPRLLGHVAAPSAAFFVRPQGIVILLGLLAMATFLVEGAVLDWGAVLLTEIKGMALSSAGAGYAAFALAMTLARLVGDRFVARLGIRRALVSGALVTAAGMTMAAWGHSLALVIAGFAIAGVGAANIVPILFTLAGRQKVMPTSHAMAATSALGYLGVFVGPALVGYVAAWTGLVLAFGVLVLLMGVVALVAGLKVAPPPG